MPSLCPQTICGTAVLLLAVGLINFILQKRLGKGCLLARNGHAPKMFYAHWTVCNNIVVCELLLQVRRESML